MPSPQVRSSRVHSSCFLQRLSSWPEWTKKKRSLPRGLGVWQSWLAGSLDSSFTMPLTSCLHPPPLAVPRPLTQRRAPFPLPRALTQRQAQAKAQAKAQAQTQAQRLQVQAHRLAQLPRPSVVGMIMGMIMSMGRSLGAGPSQAQCSWATFVTTLSTASSSGLLQRRATPPRCGPSSVPPWRMRHPRSWQTSCCSSPRLAGLGRRPCLQIV
mmetsp:Transcript_135584/g.432682  ORF Transcript_135584/g.432682 Transcript_135584/m.432682 type:complete len:211 (-) Transcript_135584:664-1296(-)